MSEKQKSRWFRFHLLTASLMALTAGAVMWVNSGKVYGLQENVYESGTPYAFGWPMIAITKTHPYYIKFDKKYVPQGELRISYLWTAIGVDAGVALFAFVVVAFASEFLIRRREARKT